MATASVNPSISAKKMEEDLLCYICYNLLQEPKDLDCPHVYCLPCLQDWVGDQSDIQCPECRYITSVPPDGVRSLKTNLRLKSLVRKYADQTGKQKDVPLCSDHEGERQHFFCLTCQTTVCHNCLVFKHPRPQHDIKELKDIARSKKEEIKVKMEDIEKQTKKSKECEKNLLEAELDLHKAAEKAKCDIRKHVQDIKAKVDTIGHNMIETVEITHQKQMTILLQKLYRTQQNLTRLQNAKSATQKVLDTAADHMYMTQHASLVDTMSKVCVMNHEAPSCEFEHLCFNPKAIPNDSNWLGSVSKNRICILKLVHEFGQFHKAQGIAANQNGLVAVIDYHAKKTEVFQSNRNGYVSKFCLVSDNFGTADPTDQPFKACVATNDMFCITYKNNNLRIFSPAGKYVRSLLSYSNGPIAATPDGTIITGNGQLQIITLLKYKTETYEILKTHKIDQNRLENIASDGAQIVYTTGNVSKVCAIDFTTGQTLWIIDMVFPTGICYVPKSDTLLIAGGSNMHGQRIIAQYCSATGRLISHLGGGLYSPLAMTVTYDKLLVADVKTVKVYEIQ